MTKEEILEVYEKQTFIITQHKPLVALSCISYEEDGSEQEFIFTVPIGWLVNLLNKLWNSEWDWDRVQDWLKHEYTYEDSKPIFDYAIHDNCCVTLNFS